MINIKLSKHAQERKLQKGISNNEIKLAIERGAKIMQKHGTILAKYADLNVVYVKQGELYFIVTIID